MEHRSVLWLSAHDAPYRVIVEPWAGEFEVASDQKCRLVALHPTDPPTLEVELSCGKLVVSVLEGGSTYEFWRGGEREFHTRVAIPW